MWGATYISYPFQKTLLVQPMFKNYVGKHPLQNRTNVQINGGGGQRPFEQCSKKLHFFERMASLILCIFSFTSTIDMIPACCIAKTILHREHSVDIKVQCNETPRSRQYIILATKKTGFFSVREICSTSFVLSGRPWQNLWPGYRLGWHWGPGQEQCAASEIEMEGRQFEMLHKRWEPLLPLLLLAIVSSPCLIVLPTALPLEPAPGPPLTSQSVIYVSGGNMRSCATVFNQ